MSEDSEYKDSRGGGPFLYFLERITQLKIHFVIGLCWRLELIQRTGI
jgi:hypothetical protein